jgi:hypothetical protein
MPEAPLTAPSRQSSLAPILPHLPLLFSNEFSNHDRRYGLKIYNDTLYASNTEKMQLVKIPLQSNGEPTEPEIFVRSVNLDDFAFAQEGNSYGEPISTTASSKLSPMAALPRSRKPNRV